MTYPHVQRANDYMHGVLSGDIVACRWIQLACKRQRDDLRRKNWEYYFDSAAAEKAAYFISLMHHTKGRWAAQGQRIELEPWQCFAVCTAWGWRHKKTGHRRFRKFSLYVPRKNGKSIVGGAIGNYMLTADGEFSAEVYSGATSEKQALEVFKPAYYMCKKNKDLRDYYGLDLSGTHKNPTAIYIGETGAKFEPVIGKPGDGASPHCALIDEYHEHKTDELLETMETGMGARDQPMIVIMTTAGSNIEGPCYQNQLELQRILQSPSAGGDDHFGLIYTIDKGDDWTTLDALKKANPNFGVSIGEEFLKARLADAIKNPRKQNTYKTKHLNIWVGARDAFFNLERWQELADDTLDIADYRGHRAWIGLDLASKHDIAAVEVLVELGNGDYLEFGKYYLPDETVELTENEHYRGWVEKGYITKTHGAIIDYEFIIDEILELTSMFEVEAVGFDPHQATMLATTLIGKGVPMIELRQSTANMSEPMKTVEALLKSGQLRHRINEAMDWMMGNVVACTNAKDEVYPRKEKFESKIDGPVALILATNRMLAADPPDDGEEIFNPIKTKVN